MRVLGNHRRLIAFRRKPRRFPLANYSRKPISWSSPASTPQTHHPVHRERIASMKA
jgi:hypothetical protein